MKLISAFENDLIGLFIIIYSFTPFPVSPKGESLPRFGGG